jgi:UDP-glucose 4-epimerase
MKERVLITGASGFVGYHLILAALENNLEVFAAVRKTSKIDHLKNLNVQYVYLEFNDLPALKKNLQEKQYHYIIHAAGITRARSANEYNRVNAEYTNNLARAASAIGNNFKKFVFISSLAAIGPLHHLNDIITEESFPQPVTAYGRSKLLAEDQIKKIDGLNYTILRPTAVYGPRDKDIFIFLKQVAKGVEPYIGRIQQKLSFIYVSDLAKASILALWTGDKNSYNLADGKFYNRYELANITRKILNVKTIKFHIPVKFVKMIAFISEKVSSLSNKAPVINMEKLNELKAVNWSCSIEKAKHDLSFYPAHDLQAGLTEAFSWYKSNNWL